MRSFVLLSAAVLTGCAQSPDRYPSLLPRPIESQSLAEPERPVPVATPDVALDAKIAEISASMAANARAFAAAAQDAEAKIAVARGLPEGSDPWLDAQTALATLDTFREPALTAQTELEELAIARGQAGQPPYPALDAAIAAAAEAGKAQAERISGLEAALAQP